MNMDKSDIDNIKIENSSSTALNENGMEINQDKPTFMLFDDIQQAVKNGAITVTLELAGKNSINDVSRKNFTIHLSVSARMDSMQQAKKLVVKFISQIIPRPRLPICISSDVIMIKVRWIKKETYRTQLLCR